MVRSKKTSKTEVSEPMISIFCVGECGAKLDIFPYDGLIIEQLRFLCQSCKKVTRWNIGTATATKVVNLPEGQQTLQEAADTGGSEGEDQ